MMKIYETINDARLVTTVEVGDEVRVVSFVGGATSPIWRAAIFQCDDKKLQDALEKSSSYGISYRLREDCKNGKKNETVELKNIEEVTNKQMAIEWMRIYLKQMFNHSVNSDTIAQTAAENGYVFLNWNRNNGK